MNREERERIREEMTARLRELKPLLKGSNQQTRDFFDEWVDNYEFGLAFELVCDFLLESAPGAVNQATMDALTNLHRFMEMTDDRIERLRKKNPS